MIDLSPLFGDPKAGDASSFDFRVFPKSGPPRWMLEARHGKPWHLKTWPRANLRARVINRVAWAMGHFGLHMPSRMETLPVVAGSTYGQLRQEFDHLGIFLGTPGPNRKIVVYAERPGRSVFVKVPLGPVSAALAKTETAALNELARDPDLVPLIPVCSLAGGHLAVENVEAAGTGYADLDVSELARIDGLLYRRSHFIQPLAVLRAEWANLVTVSGQCAHDATTRAQIAAARDAAGTYLDSLPQDMDVSCYLAHGDFTRWNVLRAADGTARIIDWELYGAKPRYFDILHYCVSQDILVAQKSAEEVLSSLETVFHDMIDVENWWHHVGLYFAFQAIYYADVYENQENLHTQAYWQLQAWSDVFHLLKDKVGHTDRLLSNVGRC